MFGKKPSAEIKARHIVLTGVTKGLGRTLAQHFARMGHRVAGCGRSAPLIASLRESLCAPHDFQVLDVADGNAVRQWAGHVLAASETPPDLLINNAAVINRNAPLWEIPEEEFSHVIDVNIKGVANVCRAFLPAMMARGQGIVVSLSSGAGRCGFADLSAYCATKWAVEGLSQSLAQDLPEGMASVALSPGIVNTGMLQSTFGSRAADYPGPEEWAETAAPYILRIGPNDNGESLTVPQ